MWAYHCIRLKGAGEEVLLKLELSVVKCRWKAERLWVADVYAAARKYFEHLGIIGTAF